MSSFQAISGVLRSKPMAVWVAMGFFGISHSVNTLLFGESFLPASHLLQTYGDEVLNIQNFFGSLTSVAAFIALLCRVQIARRLSVLALCVYFSNCVSRLRVGGIALEPSEEFLRGSAMLAFILLLTFLFSRSVAEYLGSKALKSATP